MFDPGKVIGVTPTPVLRARVAAKIRIDPVTGCHVWHGAVSTTRRGQRPIMCFRSIARVVRVARLVLEWKDGPPPSPDHEAGHTCPHGENELCVNEEHLTWQTRLENERSKSRPSSTSATEEPPTSSPIHSSSD